MLRLDGQSPTGRVLDAGGGSREFAGWVGLVAVIDELLSTRAEADASDPHGRA